MARRLRFTLLGGGRVHYDSVGDRVLNITKDGVAVFDPESQSSECSTLAIPADVPFAIATLHGFYSPELNAHFIYFAGDSEDGGQMWVYRYKKA